MTRKLLSLLPLATFLMVACSVGTTENDAPVSATEGLGVSVVSPSQTTDELSTEAAESDLSPTDPLDAVSPTPRLNPSEKDSAATTIGNETSASILAESEVRINRRVGADQTYPRFAQLLPFDGIRPVYDPLFDPAEEAPYHDDELVMGVAIEGEAKAYPVSVLRFREMVNDELAGIPILVTW